MAIQLHMIGIGGYGKLLGMITIRDIDFVSEKTMSIGSYMTSLKDFICCNNNISEEAQQLLKDS